MIFENPIKSSASGSRTWLQLLALVLLMGFSFSAKAVNCSDAPYFGVIDGDVVPAPGQIQIDGNCTVRNFPADNPLPTNFSFLTQPGQTDERWLIIFDNVVHTGNMSCDAVHDHKIWFTNGSSSKIKDNCQNLLIPVEKIDKQNPPGPGTVTVGVPFTYTLTMPILFDPATGSAINTEGSPNDLHSTTIWDDLNATGVDLTYLGHTAYWKDSGAPVPHTFTNAGGSLTFDNFPVIPAGDQIVVEITVVLEDTPANAPGTQFINTAKWDFGRLIDGVYYEPLPGEWGISPPLTIAGPELTVTKTGPATMNLGELGQFTLDIQNTGNTEGWDAVILDRLPDGVAGGMCDFTPEVLSARVVAADGTPAPGKGPLVQGTDYLLSYTGAPTCELTLTMLTAAASMDPGQRLVITYQTQLDADTQDGTTHTNVAGAVQWFNADSSVVGRVAYQRALTDGTVGTLDHEDAHTVGVALTGFFFEKSVANLTTGANPTQTAAPGDRLRYTLRLQAIDTAFNGVTVSDDLGALNASAVFVPGSLTLVPGSLPPGADAGSTDPNGGTNGAGILDVRNLHVQAGHEVLIQFDITLAAGLIDGTVVLNQADLIDTVKIADSDDPNINGQADPNVPGDEDPTQVLIEGEPPSAALKANTQSTASIGESFSYRVTVPSVPHASPLHDVRIFDDLGASAADLEFVGVTKVSGSGSWTPVNTGSATSLVIEDTADGIEIPAGEQAVIEITVRLLDTSTNVAGLTFTNTASYTYNLLDDDDTTLRPGGSGTTGPMTIVEPELTLEKRGPTLMRTDAPGTFTLDIHNVGQSPAYALVVDDVLPTTASGGMCDTAPIQITAQLFEADGVTPVGPPLAQGADFVVGFQGEPACTLTLTMSTAATVIGPDQRLVVTYQASLDADTQQNAILTNVAGATAWSSADPSDANDQARDYARALTDGTVGVLDHEDAHTVNVGVLRFEKTVANVTRGDDPGTTASPGETLLYRLVVENVTDGTVDGFSIVDELDRLNASPVFQPGTLNLITVPADADASNTSATGGASGTGVLDIRNLSLTGNGDSLLIEFEIALAPVISNGTVVENQSDLVANGSLITVSDDPNVNGAADPYVDGDEDPTRILIESAPAFRVEKTSQYMTGDPNVLLAGETLRYIITVQNVGTDNAVDATLRDQVPANTTYLPGSTTLNGEPVADAAGDLLSLSDGILINAPEDTTPGFLRADATGTTDNVATIVFDVVVDTDVVDGTVISNQAFVSAVTGSVSDQPSDDPRTAAPDDPTRDVVGAFPLLFAAKDVALLTDAGTPGVVDPGDVLRYTITIENSGSATATGVLIQDDVPANTTYVADSTTLNGQAIGQPDAGVPPLATGIDVSSADLTPPLPGAGEGTITAGETGVIQFDLRVNDGVPGGTVISNQAVVASEQLPDLLTDGDGNPATGPEPTVVVVGDGQLLSITKQVAVVGGGAAVAGSQLEYTVQVTNVAAVPAYQLLITDDLDADTPGTLSYVNQSATMNGSTAGVSVAGSVLTADFSGANGALEPGGTVVLRFRALIDPGLAIGTTVSNTGVVTWNTPSQSASATVSIDVGGIPGVGTLNGTVWHDADFNRSAGASERLLEGWVVDLFRDGQQVFSTFTDSDGAYRMSGLAANDLSGEIYQLRFRAPDAGPRSASLGTGDSPFTNGPQQISDVAVTSGANLQNLNLPIDPNGVVYDTIRRAPVAGATLTLLEGSGGVPLPAVCFEDPVQQDQVTRSDGYYKFDLNFSDPACPSGASYVIGVTVPGSGYVDGYSQIIPPASDAGTTPFSVPTCPGSVDDAVPATTEHCEAQASEFAPPGSIEPRSLGTTYYVHLTLDDGQIPGSSQIFNNHIPIDPNLEGAVGITKTTPSVNVSRGQLVPYTITVNNVLGVDLNGLTIVDNYPAGFRYIEGSATVDGAPVEPLINGRELSWDGVGVSATNETRVQMLLGVGAGVSEGEYVNRAQVVNSFTAAPVSGQATATVRVVPDPTFDCTDVVGKVFDDANRNGTQDPGEPGLQGVRLVTARGLYATTDQHGRYHITCAVVPREDRGSNFILKLDDRTLPSGYRMSTNQVKVQRATRGKALALKINYGASIHHVVGLDIADAVFEPGSIEMRPQWQPRIGLLLNELRKAPATLRLSYVADVEDADLVNKRLEAVKKQIMDAWQELDCCYQLTIEPEVFWRLGGPVEQPRLRTSQNR